jgi:outer membrane autotransporter protein
MNPRFRLPTVATLFAVAHAIVPGGLQAQTIVTNGTDFNSAITGQAASISLVPAAGNGITTVANTTTGTRGTITYDSPFPGVISFSTTITGNGNTLSGSYSATPLFIASPVNETATGAAGATTPYSVTITDLTVSGGASNGGGVEGGGGAGLGGGLFVGAGATVTLTNVNFNGNAATGGSTGSGASQGAGGIGGTAFANGFNAAGGGLFANAYGSTGGGANGGTTPGQNGGFGGGGAAGQGSPGGSNGGPGGAGGFGAGGAFGGGGGFLFGAGTPGNGGTGGAGGFGGGGGRGGNPGSSFSGQGIFGPGGQGGFGGGGGGGSTNGLGGVGGGDATARAGGGGGAGFGGAIFVQNGSTLLLTGNDTLAGDTVTAGMGDTNGAAAGAEIFMMTGSSVTLAPGAGNTITIGASGDRGSDIADDSATSLPTGQGYEPGTAAGASLTIGSASSTSGTVILLGANTYAGGTDISNDTTLVASDSGALGSGAVTVESGSTLELTDGVTVANDLTISGTGVAGAGAISGAPGVTQVGGPITLAADSTVADTGTQLRLTGTIALGANTLTVAGSSQTQLTGAMSGTGSLIVDDGAVAFVNGSAANSYTGLTTVNSGGSLYLSKSAGTLATAGSLTISGTVVDNTSGQLSTSAVVTLLGTGQFQFFQAGGSESIAGLNGTSASSQVTALNQGGDNTLTLGGSGSYSYAGAINNPAGHALSLVKQGVGTQTLTGASNFTGGTSIYGGDLQLGDGNTPGASLGTGDVTVGSTGTFTLNLAAGETFTNHILDNNSVVLDDSPSSNYTVSGLIDGTGYVTKNGGNVVTLTHANTYSGGTLISGGALIVGDPNALGTGPVVNNATLTTASVNHGMTINVGSDFYNGANGVLGLAIYGANDYDSVHLTDPAGVAHLNGELLVVLPAHFAPGAGETFDLITSSNPVQGQFTSVVTTLPSILVQATYTDNASITFRVSQLPFANLGPYSSNQLAVAENLDANALNTTSGSLTQLIGTLNGLSGASGGLGPYLDQLTPLKFGQFTSTTAANNASFATEAKDNYLATQRNGANGTFAGGNGSIDVSALTLNDPSYDPTLAMVHSRMMAWNPGPLGAISDSADALLGGVDMKDPKDMKSMAGPAYNNPWNFYIAGNVVLAQGFSQNDVAHFDSNTESVTLGTDYRLTPNFLIGIAAGYGHTDATLDPNGSSATVDSYSPGFYASYANHGWYANLTGDYLHNAYTQSRVIGFLGQTANSAPEGNEGVANLDGGYDFHKGAWTFGPLAGVQYTHLTVDGYSESGSVADLTVNSQDADSLRSRLGGRVSFTYSHCGINFTPHLDASWQHEFLDQARGITSQFTGAVGAFNVKTTNPSRDSALADLGLDAEINRTVTVFGDYEIQAGQENYFGQSVQAGVKIGF